MLWPLYKAVPDRVHPAVLHMGVKICLAADVVLPKATMPDAAFSADHIILAKRVFWQIS